MSYLFHRCQGFVAADEFVICNDEILCLYGLVRFVQRCIKITIDKIFVKNFPFFVE